MNKAQKIEQIVKKYANNVGQIAIANEVNANTTKISRLMNDDLPIIAAALAFMGLKVVPTTMRCYSPESIEAIFRLAKERMAEMKSAEDLLFDDPE